MNARAVAAAPRRRVALRGGVAVLDQVLFAGAGFATSILLARWLAPAEYGAFSLAFFVFLLVGAMHTSVLTEPMLVLGAGRYRQRFARYLGLLVRGHALLSVPLALALAAAAAAMWALGSRTSATTMAGLALASPFLLLLWLVRRAFYVSLRPGWAAVGGGVYFAGSVAALAALFRWDALSPFTAFLASAGAAALASALLLARLRPALRHEGDEPRPRDVAREHWEYGRWSLGAQAVFWSSGQVMLVIVPAVLGLGALAALAAVLNLFRPLNPLLQSLTAMLLPATASQAATGDLDALRAQTRRFALAAAGGVAAYGLVVSVFAGAILHHLYGGRYDGHVDLVVLFALTNVAATIVQVQTVLLKATGNVRAVPLVWGASAAVVLVLSAPALLLLGLRGGVIVLLASYVLAAWLASSRARRLAA